MPPRGRTDKAGSWTSQLYYSKDDNKLETKSNAAPDRHSDHKQAKGQWSDAGSILSERDTGRRPTFSRSSSQAPSGHSRTSNAESYSKQSTHGLSEHYRASSRQSVVSSNHGTNSRQSPHGHSEYQASQQGTRGDAFRDGSTYCPSNASRPRSRASTLDTQSMGSRDEQWGYILADQQSEAGTIVPDDASNRPSRTSRQGPPASRSSSRASRSQSASATPYQHSSRSDWDDKRSETGTIREVASARLPDHSRNDAHTSSHSRASRSGLRQSLFQDQYSDHYSLGSARPSQSGTIPGHHHHHQPSTPVHPSGPLVHVPHPANPSSSSAYPPGGYGTLATIPEAEHAAAAAAAAVLAAPHIQIALNPGTQVTVSLDSDSSHHGRHRRGRSHSDARSDSRSGSGGAGRELVTRVALARPSRRAGRTTTMMMGVEVVEVEEREKKKKDKKKRDRRESGEISLLTYLAGGRP